MIEVKENLYSTEVLNRIILDAMNSLTKPKKVNKVGNKFSESNYVDLITKPFEYLNCSHWFVAYFQHTTPVYPHTDNDSDSMRYVGIIPLYWDTKDIVSTIVHHETNHSKIIYPSRDGFTDLVTFEWKQNTGVIFDANMVHSSNEYTGIKTGIQIIGYQ